MQLDLCKERYLQFNGGCGGTITQLREESDKTEGQQHLHGSISSGESAPAIQQFFLRNCNFRQKSSISPRKWQFCGQKIKNLAKVFFDRGERRSDLQLVWTPEILWFPSYSRFSEACGVQFALVWVPNLADSCKDCGVRK